MGRKKILEKRMQRLMAKKQSLTARALASQDASEVRSINEQLEDVNAEIQETQEEIDAIDDEPTKGEPAANGPDEPVQQRSNPPVGAQHVNAGVVGGMVGSFNQQTNSTQQRSNDDPFATMEYRNAFKAYVQTGAPIPSNLTQRAGGDPGPTVTADLGAIIPTTIGNFTPP